MAILLCILLLLLLCIELVLSLRLLPALLEAEVDAKAHTHRHDNDDDGDNQPDPPGLWAVVAVAIGATVVTCPRQEMKEKSIPLLRMDGNSYTLESLQRTSFKASGEQVYEV